MPVFAEASARNRGARIRLMPTRWPGGLSLKYAMALLMTDFIIRSVRRAATFNDLRNNVIL